LAVFEISTNGNIYKQWKSASFTRSIDNLCGEFVVESSDVLSGRYPIRAGNEIVLRLNDNQLMRGYIDTIVTSGDVNSHTVTFTGRDVTCDIVDSSVPAEAKQENSGTLRDFCKRVVDGLGLRISVIDTTGELETLEVGEDESGSIGENAFEFLNILCRKRHAYLTTDTDGNLVVYKPATRTIDGQLVLRRNYLNNNIVSFNFIDSSGRNLFYHYVAKGQDSLLTPGADEDRTADVFDETVRRSRFREVPVEDDMNDEQINARIKEEVNMRRSLSESYTCNVAWSDTNKSFINDLWQVGSLVYAVNEVVGFEGVFLIKSTVGRFDIMGGSSIAVTLVTSDGYTGEPAADITTTRKSSFGNKFRDR
jgi:prophage tail gpP-like protein